MADITSNLVGHWKLDEGSGTTANDSSVENNDGTINGATWSSGELDFDGTNDYISVPFDAAINLQGEMTFSAKVKISGLPGVSWVLACPYNNTNGVTPFVPLIGAVGEFIFTWSDNAAAQVAWNTASGVVTTDSTWQTLTVVRQSDLSLTFYRNASVVSHSQYIGSGTNTPASTSNQFDIGALNAFASYYFDGRMKDVRLYSRALSAADVAAIHGYDGTDSSDAYPDVHTVAQGRTSAADTTSHSITMPADVAVGDIILVLFSVDGSPTISVNTGVSGSNWTLGTQASNSTVVKGVYAWKVAEGSDVLTLTTSASEQSSHISYCIKNHGSAVEGASANGSSTNSNPPSLTPSWGSADNLWIATRHGDSTVLATVPPSNFTSLYSEAASGTSGASTSSAHRKHTNSVLDPGTFTSSTEQWVSFTIAVKPGSDEDFADGDVDVDAVGAANFGAMSTADARVFVLGQGSGLFAGASLTGAALSISGAAAVTWTGGALSDAYVSVAGGATVQLVGAASIDAPAAMESAGTSAASFTAESFADGAADADGAATVSLVGASIAEGAASAIGQASVQPIGAATADALLAIAGESSVNIEGAATADGAVQSAGESTVNWSGQAAIAGDADIVSAGQATVLPVGASLADAAFMMAGTGTFEMQSDNDDEGGGGGAWLASIVRRRIPQKRMGAD